MASAPCQPSPPNTLASTGPVSSVAATSTQLDGSGHTSAVVRPGCHSTWPSSPFGPKPGNLPPQIQPMLSASWPAVV